MNNRAPRQGKEEKMPPHRVKLRDIAEALGVSLATVSLALRDHTRISDAMRERVRKKAEEMGYVPDPRMAALASYRKDSKAKPNPVTLAWLNPSANPESLYRFKEFALYREGASEAASRLGFHLEEFVLTGGVTPRSFVDDLKARCIEGILVTPHPDSVFDLSEIPASDFTIVRLGLALDKPMYHSITANHEGNGELAFRKVREKGYERIGFVTEQQIRLPFGAGVYWEQKECPKSQKVPLLLYPSADESEQLALLSGWIDKEQPDAIITDLPQIVAMLAQLGIRVPEDIALATTSIHDTPINAGIEQHSQEVGRLALLTLVSLLNEADRGRDSIQKQTVVQGEWVDGSMLPSRIPEKQGSAEKHSPERTQPKAVKRRDVPAKRVTMRDIAREVGVTHVTVSLALRNHPRISESMRTRIRSKAESMGYVSDPMLAAMQNVCRAESEKNIQSELAWFNVWKDPEKLYSYHEFEQYWKGAQESVRRYGFHLEEYVVKDYSPQRLDRILKTRNIRGILVPPIPQPSIIDLKSFPWCDYTTVRYGTNNDVPTPFSIASDQEANGEIALNQAWQLGYRRIGFVGDHAVQRTFGAGFYWALRMLPRDSQLPLFFLPLADPAQYRKKLAAWIDKERPDAIITDNSELPQLLSDLGIRVPDDIALATTSIHDTPIDAGIDQHCSEIGRMGVVSLMSHLNSGRSGGCPIENQIRVEGEWTNGGMMPSRLSSDPVVPEIQGTP